MIKKLLRNILYVLNLKKRPIQVKKISNDDFKVTSYKGAIEKDIYKLVYAVHPEVRIGTLTFGKHLSIKKSVFLDLTGDINIGDYVIFSDGVRVLTHDHNLKSRNIILSEDQKNGVIWSNLNIGNDVFFGANVTVTNTVTEIPDGVVIGTGAILTKNPSEYEIWAGIPAKKIGLRKSLNEGK